jgi:hypothetical protein
MRIKNLLAAGFGALIAIGAAHAAPMSIKVPYRCPRYRRKRPAPPS